MKTIKTRTRYTLIGSDFSQQEPRLLAYYAQDENMIKAYEDGKDLYAMIASKVYHNNYEDNLEFDTRTGERVDENAKRRSSCKTLLLGIQYGMGTAAIAEKLKVSKSEAEEIRNSFFREFPNVEHWFDETKDFARKHGYVEDVWGRRRRLPDIMKPKYEVTSQNKSMSFNPLLYTQGLNPNTEEMNSILNSLYNCKWKSQIDDVKAQAKAKGYLVTDNSGFISRTERQCVNARIQGGAASMSKRAMINVANNQELKELGFRLLIAVHDELIGECPIENKERCKELLSQEMVNAALPEVTVPMKCDAGDFKSWYYDVYSSDTNEEYKELLKNHSLEESFDILCYNRREMTPKELRDMITE